MANLMILAAGAALVLSASGTSLAGAVRPAASAKHEPRHTILFPRRDSHLLYDQTDADNFQAIVSTDFGEPEFDIYDAEAADDFHVPAGKTWKIAEVYVAGIYFDSPGSANSFNVTFYSARKGKVGRMVRACPSTSYYYDTGVDLGSEHIICKARLKSRAYFVSVQANMRFQDEGMWGWDTNNTVRGGPSMWRNPQDGLQTGCTDWAATTSCIPADEGGDFAFALYGRAVAAGP